MLQTLFYLFGATREQICLPSTNALSFKKAKKLINEDLFKQMGTYDPTGSRQGTYKDYQKLSFLKANLDSLEDDKVEQSSLVMCKVLQWLRLAVELRCDDVVARRDQVEFKRQEREKQIQAVSERQKKYEEEVAARKALDETQPEEEEEKREPFDLVKFKAEFDAANPMV